MHCSLRLFCISLLDNFLVLVLDRLFFILETKKVKFTIFLEFALADSALVVLEKWSSYRGGRLNMFNCNAVS